MLVARGAGGALGDFSIVCGWGLAWEFYFQGSKKEAKGGRWFGYFVRDGEGGMVED